MKKTCGERCERCASSCRWEPLTTLVFAPVCLSSLCLPASYLICSPPRSLPLPCPPPSSHLTSASPTPPSSPLSLPSPSPLFPSPSLALFFPLVLPVITWFMSSHPPPQARDTQVSWLKMMKKREEQSKLLLARHTKELRLAFGGWMGVSREARVCRLLAIRDEHVACLSSRLQQVQQLVGLSAISSSPGVPAKSSPSESLACASSLEHACVRLVV